MFRCVGLSFLALISVWLGYDRNGKGYLRSMDNLISRMRKSLEDGDAQKLEGLVKEALKLYVVNFCELPQTSILIAAIHLIL